MLEVCSVLLQLQTSIGDIRINPAVISNLCFFPPGFRSLSCFSAFGQFSTFPNKPGPSLQPGSLCSAPSDSPCCQSQHSGVGSRSSHQQHHHSDLQQCHVLCSHYSQLHPDHHCPLVLLCQPGQWHSNEQAFLLPTFQQYEQYHSCLPAQPGCSSPKRANRGAAATANTANSRDVWRHGCSTCTAPSRGF